MDLAGLNKLIKSKELSGAYLFYGEEQYLLEDKVKTIAKKIITPGMEVFNYIKFEGKKTAAADIIAAIDQFPQMSEMKLITVKSTGILNNATLTEFKLIKEAVKSLPTDTCLIFIEDAFDKKKLKNVSFIEESGGVIDFEYMTVNKLSVWIEGLFEKHNKTIEDRDIRYIIELCGQSLSKLSAECDKLINYTGNREQITRDDIEAVVDKTAEYRTYDMLDSMIMGNSKKAYEQLDYLLNNKTKPSYILGLMMSRLWEILMCKRLNSERLSTEKIGSYFDFKRPSFVVTKTINESKKFSDEYLRKMIDKGLTYDMDCKSGRLNHRMAVEMYLAELTISEAKK